MALQKVEGIVIGETLFGEASKILTIFTKDLGVISVMSKGCRKPKSKLRVLSSKMMYANFDLFYKENSMSTLTNGEVLNYFKNILLDYKDIVKRSYAFYLMELTQQVIKEKEDEKNLQEIYDLFLNTLLKLEAGFNPVALCSILEIKYLEYLGVKPSVEGCSVCGNKENIITLTCESFGYICRECYQTGKIVKKETIKMFKMLFCVDIPRIQKLDIEEDVLNEINEFLEEYYELHTGLYLKTKQNIKNLAKLTSIK